MKANSYIVLDLETTGLNCEQDDIIEICAVKLDNKHQIEEEFYALIKIERPLPALIIKLTGIKDSDLQERGEHAEAVFKKFRGFLGDAVLVGHNINEFDLKFLKKAFEKIGATIGNDTYDTLRKSKEFFRFYSYKLEDMALNLNIEARQFHNARSDVQVTVELFKHLLRAEN